MAWYCGRDRLVNQWKRIESIEIVIHGHLLIDKANQWKTTNGVATIGHAYAGKMNLDLNLIPYTKMNSKWV